MSILIDVRLEIQKKNLKTDRRLSAYERLVGKVSDGLMNDDAERSVAAMIARRL